MKKAVIMAGGFGTRLRPLTMTIPKPMVPIINIPMMEHIVNLLKNHGITEIVSLLYFQPDKITDYFENGSRFGISMNYVAAQADYGTAGSVKNAYEYLNERFIIISGDVLTDFDLDKAIKFHEEKQSKATLLLTRVERPLQYGIVMTDDDGRITRFLEKPSWGQVFSDTINTGIYIIEPEVLDLIPYQEDFDFSKDLFPMMLSKNMPLFGYITEGYWKDVGNLNEYQAGQADALAGKLNLSVSGYKIGESKVHETAYIAPSARLEGNNVIGKNVKISEEAILRNSVIGDNSEIGRGSILTNVTLWDSVKIGDFCEITDDVICDGTQIGDAVTISENVFIAEDCQIEDSATLNSNIKLWPGKKVESGAFLATSMVQEQKWLKELFTDARISGASNIEINPEFGAKLGSALGLTLGKKANILVSRDAHNVSRIVKRSISAGAASVGVNINDLQVVSIPQTRQELRTGRYDAGFHVRRSPRNPNNTDIIIFNKDGRDFSLGNTQKVERYFFGEEIKRVVPDEVGTIKYPERANEIYLNRFIESLNVDEIRERRFRLIMDYSFGLASTILPSILGKLGAEVISLNNYVDSARFHPDPIEDASGSDDTGKMMRSLGYDLGFRIESGAEKISLIDERGVWYSHDRLLTIVTKLFLETHKDREPYKIAVSICASKEIDEVAKDYNVEVIRIKNSHSAMMDATLDPEVIFVGGVYGGFIFRGFIFASDGMFTVGQILEMLAQTKYKVWELDELLPRRRQHTLEVSVNWNAKGRVMRKAMEFTENLSRELIEGVKVHYDNGDCVLMLPAKEKGAFTVIGESEQYDQAIALAKKYSNLINQWKEDL